MSAGLAAIGMTVGPSASYYWRSGYLAPLTLLGAFAVFVIALAARQLLGFQSGLIRTLLCAVLGLAVGGSLLGPHLRTGAETAALFTVMVGIQLLTTVLALLVIDAIVPRRSPIAWIRDAQHRTARARRYAEVSNIARRNGLVRGLDRIELARTLLRCLLRQIMVDGVFHADPHPGNILVLADGQLALLDFGSVGHLDTQLQGALQSLLLAIDQRDPAALRDALLEITDDSPDIDAQSLERSLGRLMARNLSPGLTPDAEAFADLFRIVSTYGVTVPPEIEVVFKTLATLQGTLARLAPGFDIIRESQRFSDTEITAQLTPVDLKDMAIKEVLELVPLLRRLPRRFDRITAAIERGQLSANVRLLADPRDQEVVSGYLHRALVCVLAATTGIMAVVLLASQGGPLISQGARLYAVLGYNLLVISAVLAIRVLSAQARWRRGPKDGSGWRRADR